MKASIMLGVGKSFLCKFVHTNGCESKRLKNKIHRIKINKLDMRFVNLVVVAYVHARASMNYAID